ncbi:class I SAM-dependent methyltransferase [Actinomadura parmotrematis]|uniref:Class I SAM-dependent methyltransferase n=1 Tax=Actinomadura parmotrematis TaxID=2864039 RepID=A0ABS7FL76_9ACTN|nr:class I SAM-dependent methyltransferase [Actinomadura parmotrematis]MBW8481132.1 class I SAM-dependent methyltransferase [Actinomadura parmotrematis]
MDVDDADILAEQRAYYRARANEYDRAYGERADLRRLLALVDDLPVRGDVLELACGTGQWTPLLAARARTLTAVDASAETLAIARARTASLDVRYVQADVFAWRPERRYDTVFFGFWLSHVPPARLPAFWAFLAAVLAPGGRVVFVDDGPAAAGAEDVLAGEDVPAVRRGLGDGSRYRVVKVFHDPRDLTAALEALGWSATVRTVEERFIAGVAEPAAADGTRPPVSPRAG